MVDAFDAAWALLKQVPGPYEDVYPSRGNRFVDQNYTQGRDSGRPMPTPFGPQSEVDMMNQNIKDKGLRNYMSSFRNSDGTENKRRFPGTPAFDKSRSIMDQYNLTGPKRTPMGTEGSMTDEDEEFLSNFKEEPEPKQPRMSGPQKHGLSQEQYDDWQSRLATMMPRGGSAAPN